jgi:saccharopine dehydrogenase (NADP+, L-glutamate forming)
MTDDTYTIENADSLTYRDFLNSFLPYRPHDTVELKLAHYLGLDINSPEMKKIKWYAATAHKLPSLSQRWHARTKRTEWRAVCRLGMFDEQKISLKSATPAQVLQQILEKKWALQEGEKDMIVMYHHFVYTNKNGACPTRCVRWGDVRHVDE